MACTRVIQCGQDVVHSIAIAPDGQLLAAGLWSGGILLLDARSGAMRSRLYEGTTVATVSVAFSPPSTSQLLLAAGFQNGSVRVWDCSSSTCVAELESPPKQARCVAFSPVGRLLASASEDTTVRLWRTDDWYAPPAVLKGHAGDVTGVSFSCDGRLLASCSWDKTVKLWHILDRGAAATEAAVATPAAGPPLEVGRWVYCVVFSPVDSALLAYCGYGGFLALARKGAGDGAIAVERKLQGHIKDLRSLAFSSCGQKLASASEDRTVRLWSVASSACLRVLRGHTSWVVGVAFSPDGKQLASGSVDNSVRIWTVCAWSDKTHHLFGAPLKAAVFTLMCVRARLEQELAQEQGGQHAQRLSRLPMEVWLLVFEQLQLAMERLKQ